MTLSQDAVIAVVSDALRGLLAEGLAALPPTLSASTVVLDAPAAVAGGKDARLHLSLYRVAQAAPGVPPLPGERERAASPPLLLDLDYLVNASAAQALDAHWLLGLALRKFADEPVLSRARLLTLVADMARLERLGPDNPRTLTIVPVPLTLAEQQSLWAAWQVPLRPALAYRVRVVFVR